MTDLNEVKSLVSVIGGFDDEDIKKYSFVIKNAVMTIDSMLIDNGFENDERVINLCASKAFSLIEAIKNAQGESNSFTAGDIKIEKKTESSVSSKDLFIIALDDCKALINDNRFAFLGV